MRTHPACDGEPQNIMRFLVKLGTRRYLRAEDEGADELWNDVMERWFYNELYKVSNNMLIRTTAAARSGQPPAGVRLDRRGAAERPAACAALACREGGGGAA